MSEIPPSIPFHVAKAYGGVSASLSPGRRTILAPSGPSPAFREAPARLPSPTISRLVAARVPGGIDFSTATPTPAPIGRASDAMPFYRHPADRNAAATAVTAGRVLDTTA